MTVTTDPFRDQAANAPEVPGRPTILVIEDSEDYRQIFCRALQQAGYETRTAGSADEGYRLAVGTPPALILSDIILGGENGFALLARLRETVETAAVPVILMTGDLRLASETGRRQGMGLGADDFLVKPFRLDVLLDAVNARLKKQRLEQAQAARARGCLVQILESTIDVTLIVQASTRQVVYLNLAGRRLFGLQPEQGLGGQFLEQLCTLASSLRLVSETFPAARQGTAWQGELTFRTSAGREVPVRAVVLGHATGDDDEHLLFSIVAHDITQRRELEESLRQDEAYQKTILAAIQNGIVIVDAATSEIVDVNDVMTRLTGWSRNELVGRPFQTLVDYADQAPSAIRDLRQLAKNAECTLLDRAGRGIPSLKTEVPIVLRGRPCRLECLTDVSAQYQMEAQLRASELRFRSIATATFDGIVMADPTERISFWNAAAERILGYSAAEAVGQKLHDLITPDRFRPAANRGFAHFQQTGQGAAIGQTLELVAVRKGGREVPIELSLSAVVLDGQWHGIGIVRDVTLRQQTDAELRLAHAAMDAAANGVAITDVHGTLIWVNRAFTALTGYAREEAIGRNPRVLKSGKHDAAFYQDLWQTITSGRIRHGEMCNQRKDGTQYYEEMTITPVRQKEQVTHFIAIKQDITARKQAEEERRQMEVQLRQAQKLESIGQLAAGIAHEINTPTQFVGDNIRFVQDALPHFAQLVQTHKELLSAARGAMVPPAMIEKAEAALRACDLDYLIKELPTAVRESLEGIDRIAHIVRATKEFSHPSTKERAAFDLNRAIESTITVARNEWKYVADLTLELDPGLPPVRCYAGEINQVVLNLVVNAAHAIGDVVRVQPGTKGRITIRTVRLEQAVEVQVADTGGGIPEAIRHRIFDPFFTTKDVGKGTGQGLTLAHNTVVKRHGGTLRFETTVGQGTTFFVRLPLTPENSDLPVDGGALP